MKINHVFIALTLLLCQLHSIAQDTDNQIDSPTWDLNRCITYAAQNNLQIQQLNTQVRSAKISEKQSKDNLLPTLNGSFTHGLNLGRSIDRTTNQFSTESIQFSSFSLNSNMTLYNGGIQRNRIKQSELEYQLAELTKLEGTNNLSLNILAAYLQILLSEEQLEILKEQAKLTEKQLEQSQKLVKVGVIPEGDLLDIESQIANDDLNIVNSQNAVASAYLNLSQTLDLFEDIQIEKPTIEPPSIAYFDDISAAQIYETALNTQPEIKSTETRDKIAATNLAIVKGSRLPIVSLSGQLSTNYSSLAPDINKATITGLDTVNFSQYITPSNTPIYEIVPTFDIPKRAYFSQLGDNIGGGFGLNVSVPIFNNFQVKNNIQLAKINIENSLLNSKITQNNLRQSIEQAYLDAKSAAQKYFSTQKTIIALENSMQQAEKRFQLGLSNSLDFLTVKTNLVRSQLNLKSAKYEYLLRLKVLDFYQGKVLEL